MKPGSASGTHVQPLDPVTPEVDMCTCLAGTGFRQGLREGWAFPSTSSHLQLRVDHRVPQVRLVLVNVDEAGVCGAVKYHLRHTDNHHPSQASHKAPPHSSSQGKPTPATLVPLTPP